MKREYIELLKIPEAVRIPIFAGKLYQILSK